MRACWLAVVAAVAPLACLAAAAPQRAAAPDELAAAESRRLRAALTRALEQPAARSGLRLFAEGFDRGVYSKVEVFGRGVGIWDGKRQFHASPRQVDAAIRAALDARFPEMAPTYGSEAEQQPARQEPTGGGPVRLVCAVEIEAGGAARRVEQVAGGPQHTPLLELAAGLLSRWRAAGEGGVAAASLDDGLAKIAAGSLAPESLRLTLHEKPELGTEGRGFLLEMRGRELSWRAFDSAEGYGAPRAAELTDDALRALAGRMAELAPGRLPVNLYAPAYLDLTLEVLGHRVSVQARRFAGMTAATHGAVQRDFDHLLEGLRALER
jgi:hypothetical protein